MATLEVSKSKFKAKALEYFRQIESSGQSVTITDHGEPKLEIRPSRPPDHSPLTMFRGSVLRYDEATEPVDGTDWAAAN